MCSSWNICCWKIILKEARLQSEGPLNWDCKNKRCRQNCPFYPVWTPTECDDLCYYTSSTLLYFLITPVFQCWAVGSQSLSYLSLYPGAKQSAFVTYWVDVYWMERGEREKGRSGRAYSDRSHTGWIRQMRGWFESILAFSVLITLGS